MTLNDVEARKTLATLIRIGMGLLFVSGGWNKLYQLLDPALEPAVMSSYLGAHGYINTFFVAYLFDGADAFLTPWGFLTILSTFELVTGLLLLAGLLVRPIALIYAFLLWSFVIALPVMTAPGAAIEANTFTTPAILVQIRDIGLSGLMFLLFNLGSGRNSFDARVLPNLAKGTLARGDGLGLLLRVSLAAPLIVGGAFAGYADIQTFAMPGIVLFVVGLWILAGELPRFAGAALAAILIWFMVTKIGFDKSLIANLNGIKREFAFLAAAIGYALLGGGTVYTLRDCVRRIGASLSRTPTSS